jgi:hypothetical protein
MPHNRRPGQELTGNGDTKVRVLLSTYDSRGGIEPLLGLAAGLRAIRTDGAAVAARLLADVISRETPAVPA